MPGKGCLERKAEKRKSKFAQDGPPAKNRIVDEKASDGDQIIYKVPNINELSGAELQSHMNLRKCLVEAILEYERDGAGVIVSHIGTHHKVQEAKKDECFNNMRLSDIIDASSDLFNVNKANPLQGKWLIKLKAGAAKTTGAQKPDTDYLPAPIANSRDAAAGLQAVRIEMVHALSKRGGSAQLNDIGQEPNLNAHRMKWFKGVKFIDIVNEFPDNFSAIDQGHGNFMIELLSSDVSEVVKLPAKSQYRKQNDENEKPVSKVLTAVRKKEQGKGKGKGKGKFPGGMAEMLEMAMMMGLMKGKGKGYGKKGSWW